MAQQNNIKLRGTAGNVIYYQWKDIHCMRSKPTGVLQSGPTKKAAGIFGQASRCSAVLRAFLKPVLPEPGNRSIIHATDAAFRNWFTNEAPQNNPHPIEAAAFSQLSLNSEVSLKHIYRVPGQLNITADGKLQMQLPVFDPAAGILAARGTSEIILQLMAVGLPLQDLTTATAVETAISIPYNQGMQPALNIPLNLQTAPGQLSLVAMALQFFTAANSMQPLQALRWKPAGIVGSFFN